MELPFWPLTLLLGVGACAGLATSTLGVGGSMLIVPALLAVLPLLHVPAAVTPSMALGTALAVSLVTALSSAYTHYRMGNLQKPWSPDKLGLMVCAGLGAVLGAQVVSSVPAGLAMLVIAGAQLFLSWAMLRPEPAEASAAAPFNSRAPSSRAYLGLAGFLTSIGAGGSLIVPYLSVKGVEHRHAVALAGWLGVLIGASALTIYATRATPTPIEFAIGTVHAPAALLIAAGSLLGVSKGAVLATRVNQALLRKLLAVVLILSSGRILLHLSIPS
jgi:uncharacterized membrane protein YfcA